MGREIRRVPPNWEHPRWTEEDCPYNRTVGEYKSMYDEDFESAAADWKAAYEDWKTDPKDDGEFWDYEPPPNRDFYRPKFTEEPTWYQVYQNVSEGYPVTPPFATEEELIDYLVENGDDWSRNAGHKPPSRIAATAFVKSGYAPSMILNNDGGKVSIQMGIDCCEP